MYEDAPDDIVHDLLSKATYGNHSLGYPILGTEETLSSFNGDSLRQHMDDFYTPDRVVISVAGNVTEQFIKDVEKWFGTYEAKGKASGISEPEFHYEKLTRKRHRTGASLSRFQRPESRRSGHLRFDRLKQCAGRKHGDRLFQDVREDKGLAYSVYSYHSSYEDSGMLTIYGGTGANQLGLLSETIQETLSVLKRDGITPKELENSKEQMKGSLMLSLESTNSKMSRNGKNELLLGKHKTMDEIITELNAVSLESVNGLSRRLFTDDYALSLISPTGNMPASS